MPSKTKLEVAVEKAAGNMSEARREIVMSQMREYKRNKARILEISDALSVRVSSTTSSAASANAATRVALANEMSALMKANAEISDKLFDKLGGAD